MHNTGQSKKFGQKFGQLLIALAILATGYALFFYPAPADSAEQTRASVLIRSISPEQEAVVMVAGVLFAVGLFCIFPKKGNR